MSIFRFETVDAITKSGVDAQCIKLEVTVGIDSGALVVATRWQ
jgi:hypothetical protein